MSDMTYWALVPAAGLGARMQTQTAKQYLPLFGKTVLDHTLTRLTNYPRFEKVIVAISSDDDVWPTTLWETHPKIMSTVGGNSRAHSVLNGLMALQKIATPDDWVLVHDAARPCVTYADIDALIERVGSDAVGGLLGTPVRDTMKRTQQHHRIIKTEEREHLWHAFTPQMFRFNVLFNALKAALEKNYAVTDEALAVELTGAQPMMIQGRMDNIKITYPDDIALAEFYCQRQKTERLLGA